MAKIGRNQLKSTHSPHGKNYKVSQPSVLQVLTPNVYFSYCTYFPNLENSAKSALEELHNIVYSVIWGFVSLW